MLTLYHLPISFNSRRVWVALLEKGLSFDLVELQLDGDQFQPEFLALNPLHHIPVLVDQGFRVVESLAILDYLEAQYPTPPLRPQTAQERAIVRMVELVTVNELIPATRPLILQVMGIATSEPEKLEQAKRQAATVLSWFEALLGDRPYFGSDTLTLADIVAGTVVYRLPQKGVALTAYPRLQAWCDRLTQRPSWQVTEPDPQAIAAFKERMAVLMASR